MKKDLHGMRRLYHYKPGQNAENTKISERSMELLVPKSTFDRFLSYARENDKNALLAEREAKRLAALKEATYEMSKSWDDTAQNIRRRRKSELLSRQKVEEEERSKLAEEMAKENMLERIEVIKQAKELLLYRRPNIRLLNQALLISECFRELDVQRKFQATIKEAYKKVDEENVRLVYEDAKKFNEQENKKREKIKQNALKNKAELKKQIEEHEINSKKAQELIKASEIEDSKNISKEINDIKANELEEKLKKKEEFKQMCLDGIKDKKKTELKIQDDKEFQDKCIKIFKDFKEETDFLIKQKAKERRQERIRKMEILGKRLYKSNEIERLAWEEKEKKRLDAEEERQKIKELKKIEETKEKRIKACNGLKEQIKNVEEKQKKRKKEESDLKLWETLQRYKRDEFNKEWNLQQIQMEKTKKLNYGKILKQQMIEKNEENKKAAQENDYYPQMNEAIAKANEKILSYGEQILKESEGIRPTYPITKVLTKFKKDIGLIPAYRREEDTEAPERSSKRRGERRAICTKPLPDEKILYLS